MCPTQAWQDLLHPGDATDFFAREIFLPFEPQATAVYNRVNALWLAELSRLVYRHDAEENNPPPQPTRTSFLKTAKFRQRKFFLSKETDTQAMLVESITQPPYAVLVFRGTEQHIKDFVIDLKIGKILLGKSKKDTHQGFTDALDSVWGEIKDELSKLTCPVFFTGHSLGAALATLAAARHAPQAVYTFGSPRVGNAAFAASLGSLPIHRVIDDEDVVTTLPPEELGFRHVGVQQLLKEQKSKSFLDWLGWLITPLKPLADHAPINYVDRI